MRQIFFTGKEAKEWSPLLCSLIADCAPQHRVAGFESVKDRAQRNGILNFERDLAASMGQTAEMEGKYDSDHSSAFPDFPFEGRRHGLSRAVHIF